MTRTPTHPRGRRHRPGYVLIIVLIIIVVLSLVAWRFADSMTAEQRAAARGHEAVQARHAAISGVHYAAAVLADAAGRGVDPTAAGNGLFPDSVVVQPGTGGAGNEEARFAVVALVATGPGAYETRWGAVADESGKLNLNALLALDSTGNKLAWALSQLPPLADRPDLVDKIADYMDGDQDARPNGDETGEASRPPKNGPLASLDELLLVPGMTPLILYGTDRNGNGLADDAGGGGAAGGQPRLADYVTVYGRELALSSAWLPRVNVNMPAVPPPGEDAAVEGSQFPAIYDALNAAVQNPELVDLIMAYKLYGTTTSSPGGQVKAADAAALHDAVAADIDKIRNDPTSVTVVNKQLASVVDLRGVKIRLPVPEGSPKGTQGAIYAAAFGPDAADYAQSLATLLDRTTWDSKFEMVPRVNLLTAPPEVITAVLYATDTNNPSNPNAKGTPKDYPTEAQAIVDARGALTAGDPETVSGAWLLTRTNGTITAARFKQLQKYVTARGSVYRVQSIGYVGKNGPVARVEAVIDVSGVADASTTPPTLYPRVVYFRELTDLDSPRGFPPPR